MNEQDDKLGFRKAYIWRPRPPGPGSATPADLIERAVLDIVACWNEKIPMNHVRVLTTGRFLLVRYALELFAPKIILATIDRYGRLPWQRRKKAWKKFDRFFEPETIVEKVEEYLQAGEKAEAARPPADPRVAKLQKQIFDSQADTNKWDALTGRFAGMSGKEQKDLLRRSTAELRDLCGPQTNIGPNRLKRHALVILDRDGKV